MRKAVSFLVFLGLAIMPVIVPGAQAQSFLSENPLVGKEAPDFTLPNLDNENVNMTEFRDGEKAIIFFWTTWCPHCRRALNVLKEKKEELIQKGIRLILVDSGEPAQQVRSYLQKAGVDMEVLLDERNSLAEPYGVFGIPMFIFVDKTGVVRAVQHALPSDYEKLLKAPAVKS